jgi:hypothetical protein
MSGNKRGIATDLKALDAHVVKPADAPELTDEQLAANPLWRGDPSDVVIVPPRGPSALRRRSRTSISWTRRLPTAWCCSTWPVVPWSARNQRLNRRTPGDAQWQRPSPRHHGPERLRRWKPSSGEARATTPASLHRRFKLACTAADVVMVAEVKPRQSGA